MRLYYINFSGVTTEITDLKFHTVSRSMSGGILSALIRNRELASIDTIHGYTWARCLVKNNAADKTLWEGFINRINDQIDHHSSHLSGIDGLRVLDKVACRHSSIRATGRITALDAAYIDDSEAAFIAAMVTKPCLFTDTDEPAKETVNPNSNTTWVNNPTTDDPADFEVGSPDNADPYKNLATAGYMFIQDTDNYVEDGYGIVCEYTVPNAASSTKIIIEVEMDIDGGQYYADTTETPLVEVWRQSTTEWLSVSADMTGEGRVPTWGQFSSMQYLTITITANIANYFNGTTLKWRITTGKPNATSPQNNSPGLAIYKAPLTNTYAALFDAENTTYTIDAQSEGGTRLTFTGQTPSADGLVIGDSYRVGDFLHNIMADIMFAANIWWMTLDVDSTSTPDVSDYYFSHAGPVFRDFAAKMGREVWLADSWTLKCKNSYTDTTINLTEADLIGPPRGHNSFDWDGDAMASRVVVRGAGVNYEQTNRLDYPCPYTVFRNDPAIQTQLDANLIGIKLNIATTNPVKRLQVTLDYDGGTDYSTLDIGKTIDVNVLSGKINITAGLIRELHWRQNAGEHLLVDVVIDVV